MAGLSTLARLRIAVGLSSAEVTTGATQVREQLRGVQSEAAKTKTAFDGIKSNVLAGVGLGGGIAAFNLASRATGEFTGFLKDSVQAAQEEEAGVARLNASLRANVPARDGDAAAIERQIKANEDLGFADDATRDSLTGLVAATHDVNEALRVQATAADLARFKQISLQEASDALVKVEGGRFRLLASLGIQLQDNATKEDALRAVQAVAAGQAKDFLDTTAGAGEAASAAFHDAQEALGTALLPLIKELAGVVKNDLAPALHQGADALVLFVNAGNDLAKVFNDIIAAGPKLHDAIVGPRQNNAQKSGEALALKAMQDYTAALRVVDIALADGTMTQDQAAAATQAAADAYREAVIVAGAVSKAIGVSTDSLGIQSDTALTAAESARSHAGGMDQAARAALALTVAVGTSASANVEQKQAAADAKAEFDKLGTVFDGFNRTVVLGSAHMGVYSADLDNVAMKAAAAGKAADTLATDLNGIPTDIDVNIRFRIDTAPGFNPTAPPGSADANRNNAFDSGGDEAALRAHAAAQAAEFAARQAAAAAAKAATDNAAREALAAAQKAAAEQAAAYRDKLGAAFDAVRNAALATFDAIHDKALRNIKDAHDMANAALDAQKAANQAPVDEARKAQDAILAQRELAQRQADLAAAQQETGVDPAQKAQDILRAQQALADFQAGARIAALQTNADTANAGIDKEKAKNDALATAATQAENDRATAQREAFANDLQALEASLSKHPETWAKTQQEILKLLMGYGVDYKKAAQNLGDQFAAGLVSKTRAAEEAALALFNAAGKPLNIAPSPATSPAAAGSAGVARDIQALISVAQAPIEVRVYLDGEDVTDRVERIQAARFNRVGSGIGG